MFIVRSPTKSLSPIFIFNISLYGVSFLLLVFSAFEYMKPLYISVVFVNREKSTSDPICSVNSTLSSLKAVHQILLKKPIDIETLDNKFANLVSKADDLASDINIELENYQLVLKCIIYANPLRSQFVEVNKTLDEVDELFNSGNYLAAQEKINVILNEYHPAAFDSFKG